MAREPHASPPLSRLLPLGALVVGILVASLIALIALGGEAEGDEAIGPPDYVPFVQEWEITRFAEATRPATLEWNGCGEWRYTEQDPSGNEHVGHGSGGEGGCNIPSYWFRPIDSFRNSPNPDIEALGPHEYSNTFTRSCSEISAPIPPDHPAGPDFCTDPGDTFEDRVVVEFDSDTLIPMRYSQYLDGALVSERRAVSLRLLDEDEIDPLPTTDRGPQLDATVQATAVAIDPNAGTFERLLSWIPQSHNHPLMLGDMAAWRDLTGIEAPDDLAGEEAYLLGLFEAAEEDGVGAIWGPVLSGLYWYLGIQAPNPLELSARTDEAFGFGIRDVAAFATIERRIDPTQSWGIVLGDFNPSAIVDRLEGCAECRPVTTEQILGHIVYSWGDGRSFRGGDGNALPAFDDLGRAGVMAFFDDHIIHTTDLEEMQATLDAEMLAFDPAWLRAAQIFDEEGTLYAHFVTQNELPEVPDEALERMGMNIVPPDAESLPDLDPYRFMATGGGSEEGELYTVLILAFEDAATAEANVDVVRERLEAVPEGASPQWGDPEIAEVTSEGALVVVRLEGQALGGLHLWMLQSVLPGLPPAAP